MNRLKTVLKDRSGQGTPMILAVVVCCLILACVVFEYMRLMIVAQGVRDSVQSAIVAVATENWDEAYPGLREGIREATSFPVRPGQRMSLPGMCMTGCNRCWAWCTRMGGI